MALRWEPTHVTKHSPRISLTITSSRDEFSPPEISIRYPVVDSSVLLE